MAVVGVDGALDVGLGRLIGIKVRRAHYLVSALIDRYPLFADVTANHLYRDQEVLLAYP